MGKKFQHQSPESNDQQNAAQGDDNQNFDMAMKVMNDFDQMHSDLTDFLRSRKMMKAVCVCGEEVQSSKQATEMFSVLVGHFFRLKGLSAPKSLWKQSKHSRRLGKKALLIILVKKAIRDKSSSRKSKKSQRG